MIIAQLFSFRSNLLSIHLQVLQISSKSNASFASYQITLYHLDQVCINGTIFFPGLFFYVDIESSNNREGPTPQAPNPTENPNPTNLIQEPNPNPQTTINKQK